MRKKTIKRIISDFMTILTVIAIFVFSISCLIFLAFTFISSSASAEIEKTADKKFQEAFQYANSQRNKVQIKESGIQIETSESKPQFKFKPQEVFEEQEVGRYTDNPSQTGYYHAVIQGNKGVMENAAGEEIKKDENYKNDGGDPVPTPGKLVTKTFKTREVFKIEQKEEYIKKGNLVIGNARNVLTGSSNKNIDCENKKMAACKTIQVEERCNEQIDVGDNALYIYSGCKKLALVQSWPSSCPAGYTTLFYADMVFTAGPHWDDVQFCTKPVGAGENSECYSGGYYILRVAGDHVGSGRATVPKKLHARIKISNVYFQPGKGTIINETTGEKVTYDAFREGQVIELPYSETKDQTFSFSAVGPNGSDHNSDRTGVMVLYVDNKSKDKLDKNISDNNCQQLRDKGCAQIAAKCKKSKDGLCVVQDEAYQCPLKQCNENVDIVCGKDVFCANGDCAAATPTENKNFGKVAAHSAALTEVAENVKKENDKNTELFSGSTTHVTEAAREEVKSRNSNNPAIFKGRKIECSVNILPGITKNCCNNKEGLFSCAEDEKELFQLKNAGRAIEIGEYCNNKPLNLGCTSYHTAYCVFDSRIARIVQNDGRKTQLGIGFGYVNDDDKGSHVDCRGVTIEELSKMKFDQMDFSELYAEMKEKVKNLSTSDNLKQKLAGHIPGKLREMSTQGTGISQIEFNDKVSERIKEHYERNKK